MIWPPRWCDVPSNCIRWVSSNQRRSSVRPVLPPPTFTSSGNRLAQALQSRMSSASEYLAASWRIASIDSSRSIRASSEGLASVMGSSRLGKILRRHVLGGGVGGSQECDERGEVIFRQAVQVMHVRRRRRGEAPTAAPKK